MVFVVVGMVVVAAVVGDLIVEALAPNNHELVMLLWLHIRFMVRYLWIVLAAIPRVLCPMCGVCFWLTLRFQVLQPI
jgi:hypothetical protein